MKIDYFHGMYKGTPIAQMARDDELDVRAVEMINISKGFTAQRITNLQRRWRRWKMTAASEGAPINKRKKAAEPEAKPMPRKKMKAADVAPPPKPAQRLLTHCRDAGADAEAPPPKRTKTAAEGSRDDAV